MTAFVRLFDSLGRLVASDAHGLPEGDITVDVRISPTGYATIEVRPVAAPTPNLRSVPIDEAKP